MLQLRYEEACRPQYMTSASAAADLRAREDAIVPAGKVTLVPTGVWITDVDWDQVPKGFIPELQIRARSGLARKFAITLANGIGTIDADYRDEIGVLLLNLGTADFVITKGDRIAQMALNLVGRLELEAGGERQGGFGSTALA